MYEIKKLIHQYNQTRNIDAATIALMVETKMKDTLLIPEICQMLKTIFDLQECGFFWSNAEGEFLDAWCTSPHFLNFNTLNSCANFQAEGERNWPTFTENVMVGPVCGYLLPFQNERLYTSAHFKQTYEPLGVKYLLDLVLHDGKRPYGAFLMMRTMKQGSFISEEREFLLSLIPILNQIFNNKPVEAIYSDKTITGFSLLTENGEVKYLDAISSRIVWALANDVQGAFASPDVPLLSTQLQMLSKTYLPKVLEDERLLIAMQNRWGCFDLKFEYQKDDQHIALQMTKRTPLYTEMINKLYLIKLTPMQHLIAYLLAINYSRQEIADALVINVETVTSHIKSIYKLTNTNSSHGFLLKLIG